MPKSALTVEEEAWNAYPYTKTRFTCPFVEKFSLEIETYYFPDNGNQENVFGLSGNDLRNRVVGMCPFTLICFVGYVPHIKFVFILFHSHHRLLQHIHSVLIVIIRRRHYFKKIFHFHDDFEFVESHSPKSNVDSQQSDWNGELASTQASPTLTHTR